MPTQSAASKSAATLALTSSAAAAPAGRRFVCLQEAPDLREFRLKFWDGCGLESNAIVGRRVDVEGLGTGRCTKMRQARLGGGFLHRIVFDNGLTKEVKLLHGGPEGAGASGDVAYTVEDEQPADQPWRWSDDPRFPTPRPGEIGNLNAAQTAAVESFRQVAGPEAQAASETMVLRYLRANDFDVPLASDQWASTLAWRQAEDIDSLMQTQRPPKVCETPLLLQGLYPHMMAGYDRGGRPVRVECMGRVNTAEMYKHTTEEEIMRYHAWQNEEIQRRFLPAASRRTGHEQTQVTVVLDMTGGRLGDLMSAEARAHIKNFVQVTSDYYPEVLATMVIVNAPRLLSMAWDFVSPLLDAGTKRKITIAPPGVRTRSLLHTIIHPSQLPIFLGGELKTPLDKLLPVVDRSSSAGSGTSAKDFESISGHWDGYWGLVTADSGHLASDHAAGGAQGGTREGAGRGGGGAAAAAAAAAGGSERPLSAGQGGGMLAARPQVSGLRPPTPKAAAGPAAAPPPAAAGAAGAAGAAAAAGAAGAAGGGGAVGGELGELLSVVDSFRHAKKVEQIDAATYIALAFRHRRKRKHKAYLMAKKQGRELINELFDHADQVRMREREKRFLCCAAIFL